jgi:hypothetical protein
VGADPPPIEEQTAEWEAACRKARRDLDGRPSVQIVGWRLESAFDVSHADGEPIEVPTVSSVPSSCRVGG